MQPSRVLQLALGSWYAPTCCNAHSFYNHALTSGCTTMVRLSQLLLAPIVSRMHTTGAVATHVAITGRQVDASTCCNSRNVCNQLLTIECIGVVQLSQMAQPCIDSRMRRYDVITTNVAITNWRANASTCCNSHWFYNHVLTIGCIEMVQVTHFPTHFVKPSASISRAEGERAGVHPPVPFQRRMKTNVSVCVLARMVCFKRSK